MSFAAKIAFVLPSFAGGGAERVVVNLIAALDRARFAPQLVVLDASGPLREALAANVPLRDLGAPRLRRAAPGLIGALRRLQPDAIVSSFGYVNLALLASRRLLPGRLLLREANLPSLSLPNAPYPGLTAFGYRRLYRHADSVICTSRRMADEFAGDFGVDRARLHLLPNPVDEAALREKAAKPIREPGPGLRFVAAGRLTRQKGFDRLLDMLARAPESTHLTIQGDGPDAASLRQSARRLGIEGRVAFAGFEPNPWARYAGADAFLLPSRWEGMPNAALEALACGTRVIATPESGGIAELAAAATAGAVTVAEAGAEFERAMGAVAPGEEDAVRPSLLPERFRLGNAVRAFEALLGS